MVTYLFKPHPVTVGHQVLLWMSLSIRGVTHKILWLRMNRGLAENSWIVGVMDMQNCLRFWAFSTARGAALGSGVPQLSHGATVRVAHPASSHPLHSQPSSQLTGCHPSPPHLSGSEML